MSARQNNRHQAAKRYSTVNLPSIVSDNRYLLPLISIVAVVTQNYASTL
jgi:hypothetical protein